MGAGLGEVDFSSPSVRYDRDKPARLERERSRKSVLNLPDRRVGIAGDEGGGASERHSDGAGRVDVGL